MCCVAVNASCGEMGAGLCRRTVSICQERIWHGKFYFGRHYTKTRDLCIAPSVCLFWYFYGLSGFVIFAIIIIFTLVWIWYIKKKIGGMTGDTLGATNEIAEL